MTDQEMLLTKLLACDDPAAFARLVDQHQSLIDDAWITVLKTQADHLVFVDIQQSLTVAEVIGQLSRVRQRPRWQALGLRAQANAYAIGLGEYQQALGCYHAAAEIYRELGDETEMVRSEATMIWSLANLGRYSEAMAIGARARAFLRQREEWRPLAILLINMAIMYGRKGEDATALALLDESRAIWLQLGPAGVGPLARIEQNRAILLRNRGQFEAALDAAHQAYTTLVNLGQPVEAARAQENQAVTYFMQGRSNEALRLLAQVRETFLNDGRQRDGLAVDLLICDCLLQLRRFEQVIDRCREARPLFEQRGVRFEAGQTLLNEALAYAGLQQWIAAQQSLHEARAHFVADDIQSWVTIADLESATLLLHQNQAVASFDLAQTCVQEFAELGLTVHHARALLISARAVAHQGLHHQAEPMAHQALAHAQQVHVPWLIYQAYQLCGELAHQFHDWPAALEAYEHAIYALERLRDHMMVEFRMDFVEDKQNVYAAMVEIQLALEQPRLAWSYIERAKSQSLLAMLNHRLDLSIHARSAADAPLVAQLAELQAQRNWLIRRWESHELAREEGRTLESQLQFDTQSELLRIEQATTETWHELLISNADYAREATFWHPAPHADLPSLPDDTLLIEYFSLGDRLVAFLVWRNTVKVVALPLGIAAVQRLTQLLTLNMRSTVRANPTQLTPLMQNARQLLAQLYNGLIAPFAEALTDVQQLLFVPHGSLHYVPLHALYDGQHYLIERCPCRFLPSASLLTAIRPQSGAQGMLSVGYSQQGRLPYVVDEAQAVAALFGGQTLLEEQATLAEIRALAPTQAILHLATHGEFRPDNALFSGLALADGRLTTLDLFNMRLQASLVTLSACQTGQSVLGGGDELLGLMRALFYAGASSLLLSLWPVEDRQAAVLMQHVYQQLATGMGKAAAVRMAQMASIAAGMHPYFWAPYMLVGDAGAL
jgi:CHAT domain-containing protein/tetratricopeptide (TPR) repeat protein